MIYIVGPVISSASMYSQIQYFEDLSPREASSGNVDLDVIEEYLQEHSVEVMSGSCVQRTEDQHRIAGTVCFKGEAHFCFVNVIVHFWFCKIYYFLFL